MSVVGIDFGTRCSVIAVLQGRKVDVIANEVSLRQTAGCVGFTSKKRELGEQGLDQFARNARNTVLGVKALIGRKLEDPTLKQMLRSMGACKWIETNNGGVGVEVSYLGATKTYTAEQLCAMLLTKLKSITEIETKVGMVACVVSVPGWWSHTQRTNFLNAAKIAALPVLRIVNDLSAAAFNYGFFHPTEFTTPAPVMFLDMGYSSFGCSIFEMSTPGCKVLGSAYDTSTGGWEIDQLLAEHFAEGFNKKNNCTIQNDPRGWLKLLSLVEKAKKTLNMNELAVVGMDCISEDRDLAEKITRPQYLELLSGSGIAPKCLAVIQKALDQAGLKVNQLHSVEWIGSSLRVTAIREQIQAFLGDKPLNAQMNAEEAVAIGCCLMCARLSPTSSTRAYDLTENTGRSITLSYSMGGKEQSFQLLKDNYSLPKMKAFNSTFPEAKPVQVEMRYTDPGSVCFGNDIIAQASIPEVPTSAFPSKLRLKSKAEPFGIFGFVQADFIEEKEETVEVPIVEEKPAEKPSTDTEMKEASEPSADTEMKEATKPQTRTETRKVNVETKLKLEITQPGTMSNKEVEAARMDECEMKRSDALVIATADAKNGLEAFVYSCAEQRTGPWKEFGSPDEFTALEDICAKTTQWLYSEGDDVTKEEYDAKMSAVLVFSEPIRLRLVAKQQAEEDARRKIEDEKRAQEEAAKKAAEEAKKAEEAAKKASEETKMETEAAPAPTEPASTQETNMQTD